MGDAGFRDKHQGVAYLAEVVVDIARKQMHEAYPEVSTRIAACGDPELAAQLALESDVTSEAAVKVLNEVLALELAMDRLTNALSVASLGPDARSPSVSRLAEDGLHIALSAVVDSARRTLETAVSAFVGEDVETRALRAGWREWTKKAKQDLSRMREPVAHGEAFHMDDFGKEKIWEGSILLGVAGHDLIRSVAEERDGLDHAALERRVQPLQQVALLLIAKVFAETGAVAALLERRCL